MIDFLAFFSQTFEVGDLLIVGLLVLLEGVLSIDNALVLGILAGRLPKDDQAKALTYGLIGAFVFRIIAIATASFLLSWHWVKLAGGAYLVYIAVKHFLFESDDETPGDHVPSTHSHGGLSKFWMTVLVIELTDIAFAVDSILAAIAMVDPAKPESGVHPKLWVVVTGGMLGVIVMRFAAVLFIKLLEKFPRFNMSAYLLVALIGGKLLVDWYFNHGGKHVVDFHKFGTLPFTLFWGLMLAFFAFGFLPKKTPETDIAES